MKNLVSVIIPTFNRLNKLIKAIDSVQKQTYKNYEIIVVDNSSVDGTVEYLNKLNDDKIVKINIHNNGNIAKSRNLGINNSKGDILAFLDSDDLWFPNKLSSCIHEMNEKNLDFIYHNMRVKKTNSVFDKNVGYFRDLKNENIFNQLIYSGPAFITWDTETENYNEINPNKNDEKYQTPEDFGDNWNDNLDKNDMLQIERYFKKFYQIKKKFGFLSFKVGSTEFNIKLSNKNEGIQFQTPRNSLIFSINNNIFDDVLIGNFMKVRLINVPSLYPNFTPFITKYGDNGNAYSKYELKKYFEYYKLNSANYWNDFLKIKSEDIIRTRIEKYKNFYFLARSLTRKFS